MQEILRQVEQKCMKDHVPECRIGDTVRVMVRVKEGSGKDERTRLQAYEGVVIGMSGGGIGESIRVRRVTHGIGIERNFPVHSPVVQDIQVVRHGKVRRAKLYYLRDRVGKKARVREEKRDVVIAREKASRERAEAAAAARAAREAANEAQASEGKE